MVLFTLIKKGHKFPISYESQYAESEIYNSLDGFVDTLTAIDASSWCTLAVVGDVYEHPKFSIVCEEV